MAGRGGAERPAADAPASDGLPSDGSPSAGPPPEGPITEAPAGGAVRLERLGPDRLALTGPGADPAFEAALAGWLAARQARGG